MSRGEDIAKFLIEQGNEWTTAELLKKFNCSTSSLKLALRAVRKIYLLSGKNLLAIKRSAGNGAYQIHYRAVTVDRGVGLLSMNNPINKHQPSRVHKHND